MSRKIETNAWSLTCYNRPYTAEQAFQLIVFDERLGEIPKYRPLAKELKERHPNLEIIHRIRILKDKNGI